MNSLISVIIPVYNTEQYLHRCLNSVINQTYENLEIIIVNDGSSDNSAKICDDYATKDGRIKVIHKSNEGQGVARNIALDICKADYISFIDSDDWIEHNMYEIMMEQIHKNKADLAVCGICTFNDIRYYENNYYNDTRILNNYELMRDYVSTTAIHTGPCNKLYKKDLFSSIRFPNIRAREDAYIMHEILALVNVAVYIPEGFYIQYIRAGSTEQSSFNLNKLYILDVSTRLQEFIYTRYPVLYDFVKYKHSHEIINVMKEIIRTFSYFKFRDTYRNLINKLDKESNRISQNDKNLNELEFSEFRFPIEHKVKFFIMNIFEGIKMKIKYYIKKLWINVKIMNKSGG